uniref:Uncharacterized protein LOC111115636 n=1 Tax=Crassostrea virginica TaxID=6565 RepID=A0A8B8C398_CRAVI|nr:uncharacterized protein LOC111115636 [Crassostrea virginica]
MIGRVVVLFCCLLGVLPSTPVVVVFGCVWGSYGNNCNLTCQSICSDNKTCDVVTGRCPPEPGRSPITAILTAVVLAVSLAIAVIVSTSLVQRMRTKRRQRISRSVHQSS